VAVRPEHDPASAPFTPPARSSLTSKLRRWASSVTVPDAVWIDWPPYGEERAPSPLTLAVARAKSPDGAVAS
jgi:hypothetical protein